VKIGFAPRSLVGGVMAHQDDEGLRSVKISGHAGSGTPVVRPSGSASRLLPWRRLQNRKTDRWNHARRGYEFTLVSLGRRDADSAPGVFSSATTSSAGVHQSLRTIAACSVLRDEAVDARVDTGCCFLRDRAGQTRRSKGDPGAARRVQESRLSWRLSATWSFFGRASEQST